MYVCMYVRTYVRTYVCMYVGMYVCRYVCTYVRMCVCVYVWNIYIIIFYYIIYYIILYYIIISYHIILYDRYIHILSYIYILCYITYIICYILYYTSNIYIPLYSCISFPTTIPSPPRPTECGTISGSSCRLLLDTATAGAKPRGLCRTALTSWASQSSCTDFGCGTWFWVVVY